VRRLVALLFAPTLLVSACLFPDLSGLSTDASVADATSDVVGDTRPDAMNGDGAPDGSEASALGFCASLGASHTFCDDFDEGPYGTGFASLHTSMHASMGLDGAEYTSPPFSFFATIDAGTSSDDAFMVRDFGSGSAMTYAFDFRMDEWTVGYSAVMAAIVLDDNTPMIHTFTVYTTDTYTSLEEEIPGDAGSTFIDHKFSTPLQLATWVRISFTIDLGAKTCSAMLNGTTVVPTTPLDSSWAPGDLEMNLGFIYLGGETSGWKGHWDNVVVDVSP
jgi:hypothetical protein